MFFLAGDLILVLDMDVALLFGCHFCLVIAFPCWSVYLLIHLRISSSFFVLTGLYEIDFSENEVEALSESHDLCIGGDCFEMLQQTSAVIQVIPYVKVLIQNC